MTPKQELAFEVGLEKYPTIDFHDLRDDVEAIVESVLAVKPEIKFEWTKIDSHVQVCHVNGALIGKICEQYDFLENDFVNESWTNKWRGYFINQHGSGSSECEERSRTAVETAFTEWYNGIGGAK